jgi:hypothetical protein
LRRTFCAVILLWVAAGCTSAPKAPDAAALEADAAARIQSIPQADPAKYSKVIDMRNWRNPYIIVRNDGVRLLDADNHEERQLKPEELPQALAQLPSSAWPYGRVVCVNMSGVQSGNDQAGLLKNRGIVAGALERMKVTINWVPSA